jgi:hypothetical protein
MLTVENPTQPVWDFEAPSDCTEQQQPAGAAAPGDATTSHPTSAMVATRGRPSAPAPADAARPDSAALLPPGPPPRGTYARRGRGRGRAGAAAADAQVPVPRSTVVRPLTCGICSDILRDATTITECLHVCKLSPASEPPPKLIGSSIEMLLLGAAFSNLFADAGHPGRGRRAGVGIAFGKGMGCFSISPSSSLRLPSIRFRSIRHCSMCFPFPCAFAERKLSAKGTRNQIC